VRFRIINFAEIAASFELKAEEAIKYFRSKGLRVTFDWRDMIAEEHDAAFTIAKMMDADLLRIVQERVTEALEQGTTLRDFAKQLIPELQKSGWWGKKDVVDPLTGKVTKAQLGSASRLETVFRTNLQSAYSVGRWDMIHRNAQAAPYLMYDAVDDHRTRASHAQWDNVVLPVTNAFWDEWMPPNGYNCRCGTIQLSADDLEDYGLKVSEPPRIKREVWTNPRTGRRRSVPDGIDPGWDQNPGKRRIDDLNRLADEKARLLPPEQAAAARKAPKPLLPEIAADEISV
jgi:SPP1 gp7 family putative phage head morphogenesis protein